MGKMAELDVLLKAFMESNQRTQELAEEIRAFFSNGEKSEDNATEPTVAETAKPLTLAEVRAVLADKSRAGYTAQVRELLKKYGAERLSEIDPANYNSLLADVEALEDAN
jgi:hypothetical protein